jgi:hypothetical protein
VKTACHAAAIGRDVDDKMIVLRNHDDKWGLCNDTGGNSRPVFNHSLFVWIYCRESGSNRILSPSPPVLPAVRTTLTHLSSICHRRLGCVSVFDKVKNY